MPETNDDIFDAVMSQTFSVEGKTDWIKRNIANAGLVNNIVTELQNNPKFSHLQAPPEELPPEERYEMENPDTAFFRASVAIDVYLLLEPELQGEICLNNVVLNGALRTNDKIAELLKDDVSFGPLDRDLIVGSVLQNLVSLAVRAWVERAHPELKQFNKMAKETWVHNLVMDRLQGRA